MKQKFSNVAQKNFKVELIPRAPKNRDKLRESGSKWYIPRGLPRNLGPGFALGLIPFILLMNKFIDELS